MKYWIFNTRGEIQGYVPVPGSKRHLGRKKFGIVFKSKELATLARDRVKKVLERVHKL